MCSNFELSHEDQNILSGLKEFLEMTIKKPFRWSPDPPGLYHLQANRPEIIRRRPEIIQSWSEALIEDPTIPKVKLREPKMIGDWISVVNNRDTLLSVEGVELGQFDVGIWNSFNGLTWVLNKKTHLSSPDLLKVQQMQGRTIRRDSHMSGMP
ncbi:MAG: hypothetical protein ACMG6E_05290 [Candidatus Roizmanbacteria bacterium]